MNKTIKTKCPVTAESIIIEILEPGSRILTQKRDSEGRYRLIPRKETEYPKYLIHCPSAGSPHLANLPSTLQNSLRARAYTRLSQELFEKELILHT